MPQRRRSTAWVAVVGIALALAANAPGFTAASFRSSSASTSASTSPAATDSEPTSRRASGEVERATKAMVVRDASDDRPTRFRPVLLGILGAWAALLLLAGTPSATAPLVLGHRRSRTRSRWQGRAPPVTAIT